jgi:vacuolar-type H+-ATPase subunit C/Vma6
VKPLWDDVNARARGLASHLLGRERLLELRGAAGLKDLVGRLERMGVHLSSDAAFVDPTVLEAGLRREAGRKLLLLARWCGSRTALLQIVFEEEDHRSLRALLRGAVAAIPPEVRLDGLIPTAALPMRALDELAHQPDLRTIGALLTTWHNPYAAIVGRQDPRIADLVQLEVDLAREFLGRSLEAARAGDDFLRSYTRLAVDLENLRSAFVLAADTHERPPEEYFIPGGERITLNGFRMAAGSTGGADAIRLLVPAFRDSTVSAALLRQPQNPAVVEEAIFALLLNSARSAARLAPLGTAPVIHYALSLRGELRYLQRLVWAMALGVPPPDVPSLALAS